jgi:hypothetical protein
MRKESQEKNEPSRKKGAIIGVIVIAAIIGTVSVFALYGNYIDCDRETDPDCDDNIPKRHDSISSGPLFITQYEHRLGENVFVYMRGLMPNQAGEIKVYTPKDVLFNTIPYNGSIKSEFNLYFKPDTTVILGLCTKDDLVGEWVAEFTTNEYPPLKFVMLDEYIIGGEKDIEPVC